MTTRTEILKLLADGTFHSGTDMGQRLGISRAAICKGIHGLTQAGVDIHRISGRGYRLETPLELLDERRLRQLLADQNLALRGQLTLLEEIDSTNRYLLAQAATLTSGATCLAEAQPAGRGRRGRSWVATPYANLALSMAWQFSGGPGLVSGLSLAAGVAVVRALEEYGVSEVALKWPNDILWQDRKLAGLLADVQGEAAGPCLVVLGVGVNGYLNARDGARIDQPWTDLTRITGQGVARNRLAALVILHLHRMFETFAAKGLPAFRAAWQERHRYQGQRVRLFQGSREFHGTVAGIDDHGALLIRDAQGATRAFHSGEISLRVA
jgi:BirA family biotin operon repressor/biotin-[acetyl-CoA-carboxylase] ligase